MCFSVLQARLGTCQVTNIAFETWRERTGRDPGISFWRLDFSGTIRRYCKLLGEACMQTLQPVRRSKKEKKLTVESARRLLGGGGERV